MSHIKQATETRAFYNEFYISFLFSATALGVWRTFFAPRKGMNNKSRVSFQTRRAFCTCETQLNSPLVQFVCLLECAYAFQSQLKLEMKNSSGVSLQTMRRRMCSRRLMCLVSCVNFDVRELVQ